MPPLARNSARLLSRVNGKPHANSEDHEERSAIERYQSPTSQISRQEDVDVNAEPLSSDDERMLGQKNDPTPPPPSQSSTTAKRITDITPEQKSRTYSHQSKRRTTIKVPKKGTYIKGKAHKMRKGWEEEKENENECSQGSSKRVREEEQEEMFDTMAYGGSQPKKAKVGYSSNIHAPAKAFGKQKGLTTTRGNSDAGSMKSTTSRIPKQTSTSSSMPRGRRQKEDSSSKSVDSDCSLLPAPQFNARSNKRKSNSATPERPRINLLEHLGAYASSQPSQGAPPNLDPTWSSSSSPLSEPTSSPPTPPRESLQTLERYLRDLDNESDNKKCPLCQKIIPLVQYYGFWKGKPKTVRNQTLFCKEHKRDEAIGEYKKSGYPDIDWDGLPSRIKKFNTQIEALLRNTTKKPSTYREEHATTLSSGRDHTVRRMMERDSSFMDCPAGYYGPRGKRIMMETITAEMTDVIRECAVSDPVVGRSGFAVFLQAVLVPELTVLLIQEDNERDGGISEAMAKQIMKESEEVGMLVNEEIEDEVVRVESEEESEPEFYDA